MITNGLNGSMHILSGSALMMCEMSRKDDKGNIVILPLPKPIEWNGTLVFAEFPIQVPENFNLYKYIG